MAQGPGPGATTPAGTGRAAGAGPQTAPNVRIVRVNGELWQVPAEFTDDQIKQDLGATPDPPQSFPGETRPEMDARQANDQTFREVMGALPGAAMGGMQMAGALKEPALQLGKRALMRAAPNLKPVQAVGALQRGAGALRASNLSKVPPATREAMQEAIKNAGPTIQPTDLAVRGGIAHWLGGPWLAGAATVGKVLSRPKPLSHIAQGIASAGPAAGPAVGAVGGGLASYLLNQLAGGR